MGPLEADSTSAGPTAPPSGVSRQSSRRSLRGSDPTTAHPLLASSSSQQDSQGTSSGPYAVYSASKRRAAGASGASFTSTSPSLVSPGEGPLSPSSSAPSSTVSSPPFAPTSAPFLPPLVSRPSNSTLPSPSGRQYARSVSEAKEQLQRQALKAELQALGLAAESAGAALVTRVASVGAEPELKGLLDLVARGKATLLLPAEKLDSPAQLTHAFLLDHVVLLDAPSSAPPSHHLAIERGFATLSGLRGVLTGGELVFTSCGGLAQEGETAERDLAKDETLRALRGVAPLPAPPTGTTYPSNMLISAITHLSVPLARPSTPSAPSPPPTSRTTSRLAALFAKQAPSPTPADSSDLPPVVAAPAGLLSGEASTAPDADPTAARKAASIDVPVLAVGKVVRRDQVVEAMTRATAAHIRREGKAVPGVEGDADVLGELAAFATSLGPPSPSAASGTSGAGPAGPAAPVKESLFAAEPADVSDAYQDAMHNVRLNLSRNLGSPTASTDADASSSSSASAAAAAVAPSMEDFSQLEERVDAALEQLEDLATSVLHDRLFAPRDERTGPGAGGGSRDLQEDENLASRIAALNVLELGLDHLGIDLGDDEHGEELPGWEGRSSGARESLEDLAALVRRQLNRLEDPHERTPSAKLAILVECHKVLVDGLSKLPPVPLKKDLDEGDKASLSDHPVEVEMDDASSRSSSLPPSRAMSPPPPLQELEHKQSDDELLKTPRAPLPNEERDVPEIKLPEANELSTSVLDATSSSMFERPIAATAPSPPVSIFETKRRPASIASTTATSSADLILPLLIYSVVRANPPHLVSHLHFVHRFRSESLLRGQSSFCATNFDAVVEFLNHVDVSSLGLSSSKLLGGGAPTPSLGSSPSTSSLASPTTRPRAYTTPSLLRSRVSTTADQLVGSANTALSGVVAGSYHMLFGPKGLSAAAPRSLEDVKSVLEGARGRARESLPFRRSATFSRLGASQSPSGSASGSRTSRAMTLALDGDEKAAPLAVSAAGSGPSAAAAAKGEEMVNFTPSSPSGTPSAPTSIAEAYAPPPPPRHPRSTAEVPAKDKDKDDDARSIRSVSSFLNFRESSLGRALGEVRDGVVGAAAGAAGAAGASVGVGAGGAGGAAAPAAEEQRAGSFSGRLAGLSGLHRFAGGGQAVPPAPGPAASTSPVSSRRSSLLNPLNGVALSPWATSSSTSSSPTPAPIAPLPGLAMVAFQPNSRFLDLASASDLKLGEVQLLLDEYRRLAKAVVEAQQRDGEQKQAAGAVEVGIKEEVEGDE
ncbi:hypothetical protein JCM9279_005979 [Rhodotorula babjevae]